MIRRYSALLLALAFLLPSVSFAASGPNLVSNPSVETGSAGAPTGWSKSHKAANSTTFTYPVAGFNSTKALRVRVTNHPVSGDEGWYFAEVPVVAGKSYTFTDSYTATVRSYVSVRYHLANGSYSYSTTSMVAASTAWSTATRKFTVPANATAATVLHALEGNGTLITDNFSLTENIAAPAPTPAPTCAMSLNPASIKLGSSTVLTFTSTNAFAASITNVGTSVATSGSLTLAPATTTQYVGTFSGVSGTTTCSATAVVIAPVVVVPPPATTTPTITPPTPPVTGPNLIQNGTFETGTTGAPLGWTGDYWGTLTAKFVYPVAGKNSARAAQVQVTAYTDGDAKWYFDHVAVSSHTIYRFTEDYTSNVLTNVTVEYKMADGSYNYQWLANAPATSGTGVLDIQVTVPAGAVSLTILHALTGVGTLTIDNASLVALPASPFASGMVTLTFDDGLLSQYQNALPILTAAGFKAGFYIITGQPGSGDPASMTWAQVKDVATKGHEVGGHTRTHAALTTLAAAALQSEVTGSYTDLVAQGITPKTFLYPYGDVNAAVKAAVSAAGYKIARGSYFGMNGPFVDHYNLYDIRLDKTSDLATIKKYVDQAVQDKRWLVLELHDVVASGGDDFAITPAFFQSLVTYLKQSGISVVTLEQGLAQLNP